MLKKIIKIIVPCFMAIIAIGAIINYYVTQPKDFPEEMCWKNKYLVRLGDDGSVYTRIRDVYCETENGIIILEGKN